MLFSWKKNWIKEKIFSKKNNNDLVQELKENGITDRNILATIKKVPRELFVNKIYNQLSYENRVIPIECEQTTSQPYVIAYMIECLKIKKTDKILEIGTGTGYQTAIISHLCQEIYTIELFDKEAQRREEEMRKEAEQTVRGRVDSVVTEATIPTEAPVAEEAPDPLFNHYMGELGKY